VFWAKSIKLFGDYGRHLPLATYAKILQIQAMARFGLKIEKLSHIMGAAQIVELARAYGLHPRLWHLFHYKGNIQAFQLLGCSDDKNWLDLTQ